MSARPRTFFDTSSLLYATDPGDPRSGPVIAALATGGITSVQVLCEFTTIVRARLGCSWPEVHEALGIFGVLCPKPLSIRLSTYEMALELVQQERLTLSDALVAASAIGGGCLRLFTDMAPHDRVLGERITVFNPFAGCSARLAWREAAPPGLELPSGRRLPEGG